MENIRRVLESYHIFPTEIDRLTERLYRVKGNKQTYALKKGSFDTDNLSNWLHVYHVAQRHNLFPILPVYLTHSGNLYAESQGDIYYLTPWIESENRKNSIDKVYAGLGLIHAKTTKSQPISDEMRETSKESFLIYKQQMAKLRKQLLQTVEEFESRHFMSPVELLVCTQYRDIVKVFYLLDKRLDQYLDYLGEVTTWRVCLNHQKLQDPHLLQQENAIFINWEHASYQHPIVDISILLKDRTTHYDHDAEQLVNKFSCYLDENKLEVHELTLLAIYLLDPTIYMNAIRDYSEGITDASMIEQVILLQRLHRQLLFAGSFSQFVESEYEMVSFDESSQES